MEKRTQKRDIRKITKIGKKSFAVTIPIDTVRSLGWRERQRVAVKRIKGGVTIRDYRSKR
ncbi:MAG: hypothetical protein NT136_02655 [Candidatus Moranbacteria bacterium]|nr:hypothetical protein [Candidatus Moranbacteria bacterium]